MTLWTSSTDGSSSATQQEVNAALAYTPQYDPVPAAGQLSAASRGQACWGDTLDNEDFLPSTKECFEDRIMQAMIIRCRLERSLEPIQREFVRIVLSYSRAASRSSKDVLRKNVNIQDCQILRGFSPKPEDVEAGIVDLL